MTVELVHAGSEVHVEARLRALAAYDIDIVICGRGQTIPLCRRGSGYDAAGLDYLIGMSKQYYDRQAGIGCARKEQQSFLYLTRFR
jgi:hypothetical protein